MGSMIISLDYIPKQKIFYFYQPVTNVPLTFVWFFKLTFFLFSAKWKHDINWFNSQTILDYFHFRTCAIAPNLTRWRVKNRQFKFFLVLVNHTVESIDTKKHQGVNKRAKGFFTKLITYCSFAKKKCKSKYNKIHK